jgi:hypothetical protein
MKKVLFCKRRFGSQGIVKFKRPQKIGLLQKNKKNSTNNQDEIPYINAEEARKAYAENHSIDNLRKLVYSTIKELAPTQTSASISIYDYPNNIVDLMEKELKFKNFFVRKEKDVYDRDIMKVAW